MSRAGTLRAGFALSVFLVALALVVAGCSPKRVTSVKTSSNGVSTKVKKKLSRLD